MEPKSVRAAERLPGEGHEEEVLGRSPMSRHIEIAHEKQHANQTEGQQLSARATPVPSERKRGEPPSAGSESRAISAMVRRPQAERVVEGERGLRVGSTGATSGALLRRLRSTERVATAESREDAVAQSSPTAARPILSSAIREPGVAPGFNAKTVTTSNHAAVSAIHAGELANDAAALQPRRAESAMQPVKVPARTSSAQIMPPRVTPPGIPAAAQSSEAIEVPTARGPANHATESEPAMRVTIGRVEVRAVFQAPAPRRAQPAKPRPALSLDDYLKRDVNRNINRNVNRNPGPR